MSFKVIADYDRCKSHAECMRIVPEVFEVRDDGYMYILVEACPTQALRIAD